MAGTVTRSVANGPTGERLLDWTGSGSNLRFYGTNGHHDVTWLAGSTGTVSAALRYDPWGTPRATVPTGYTPLRFQGSYLDDTSGLAWVVTRWYAHTLGRFISEDTLLGEPADPPSRHLYAYGAGEPVGRWDPDGRFWHKVKSGETLRLLAVRYLRSTADWRWIFNRNRRRIWDWDIIKSGWCLWTPNARKPAYHDDCDWGRKITKITDERAIKAASALGVDLELLTYPRLISLTRRMTGRSYEPTLQHGINRNSVNGLLAPIFAFNGERIIDKIGGVTYVDTTFDRLPVPPARATTIGGFVFVNGAAAIRDDGLTAHEYIHVLYAEAEGLRLGIDYGVNLLRFSGLDPRHPYEALGYLWQGYIDTYGNKALDGSKYGDNQPWCTFKPSLPDWDFCP